MSIEKRGSVTLKISVDTEFNERPGAIDLISIGLAAEDGREFYAVSAEFDEEACNDWVKANVLPKLAGQPRISRAAIRDGILAFIGDATPEFWAYFADYDWVVFCWLFGAMVDLPKGWPMFCRDLKQAMEERGLTKTDLPPQPTDAHHALADARWNLEALAVVMRRARPKLCVAALITDGVRIALVRNSKPGRRVETPGGKAKDGEAWPQAMTREIEEETGLFVPPADWVVIDVLCGEPVPGAQFASTIIVARATTSGPHPLRAGSDAADAQWYTRDEIPWGQLSAIKSREVIERWARSGVGASDDLIDAVLAHRTEVLKRRPTPAQERAEHMWRLAEREAAARLK